MRSCIGVLYIALFCSLPLASAQGVPRRRAAGAEAGDPDALETLFDQKRDREAIEDLNKVIAAPVDPQWERRLRTDIR